MVGTRAAALAVACLAASGAAAQPAKSIQERFAACMACHGEAGRSTQALTPSLAGQPSFYAITQLFLFREGRRNNEAMTAQAKGMSDDDLRAFSDLIGTLPPPPAPAANVIEPQRLARGAALVLQHRCASCHGVDYAGGQQVARLAYQREDYLIKALTEFRSGKRLGYTSAMSETLIGIQPEALRDVAHYLANLPRPAP
jgi:cytochrome c553